MLTTKTAEGRQELAKQAGLDSMMLDEYRPVLTVLDVIDDGGEECKVCMEEGAFVAVNFYGRTTGSEQDAYGTSCRACVKRALELAEVDPYGRVEIEYLPLPE
jgi:hypothetical protein